MEKIGDTALNEKMNHKNFVKEAVTGTSVEINMRLAFQRFELLAS